jgi:hypothetical protein
MKKAEFIFQVKRGETMVGSLARPRVALVTLLAAGVLTGCSEYMDRKNTVAFSAGDAVQTNVVTHVIDPWPPRVQNTNIAFDGKRMQRAVAKYRCGPSDQGSNQGQGGFSITVNSAPAQDQGGQGDC